MTAMTQHTWKCTIKSHIVQQNWTQNWVAEGAKGMTSKAKCLIQLLFNIRHDPLKLPWDPLKVVVGSPNNPLKILANGSPDINHEVPQLHK